MCSTGHTSIHDEDGEETQGEKQHKTIGSSSSVVHVLCCTPYLHVAYVISAHLQHIGCFGHQQPKWPCSTLHVAPHTQDGISQGFLWWGFVNFT
jgi:hypothetical protein